MRSASWFISRVGSLIVQVIGSYEFRAVTLEPPPFGCHGNEKHQPSPGAAGSHFLSFFFFFSVARRQTCLCGPSRLCCSAQAAPGCGTRSPAGPARMWESRSPSRVPSSCSSSLGTSIHVRTTFASIASYHIPQTSAQRSGTPGFCSCCLLFLFFFLAQLWLWWSELRSVSSGLRLLIKVWMLSGRFWTKSGLAACSIGADLLANSTRSSLLPLEHTCQTDS